MSDALEFVRNSSMAGEEVAGMVDTLLERIEELERERRIEELERTCQDHGEIQAALCKQIDALQADNARLREALEHARPFLHGNTYSGYAAILVDKALAKVRKPE